MDHMPEKIYVIRWTHYQMDGFAVSETPAETPDAVLYIRSDIVERYLKEIKEENKK